MYMYFLQKFVTIMHQWKPRPLIVALMLSSIIITSKRIYFLDQSDRWRKLVKHSINKTLGMSIKQKFVFIIPNLSFDNIDKLHVS